MFTKAELPGTASDLKAKSGALRSSYSATLTARSYSVRGTGDADIPSRQWDLVALHAGSVPFYGWALLSLLGLPACLLLGAGLVFQHVALDRTTESPVRDEIVVLDQSLTPELGQDPLVARMLECFERRTGLPVVVNTSLNTAGRPMVDDPRDAPS